MQKMYAGGRLRALREQRGLSQSALAKALGISVSYVNQLEHDQRPLTVQVLLRLNGSFDLDMGFFAADTDARLIADLQDVFAEDPESVGITHAEIDDLVARVPAAAHLLVGLHRRLRGATEQLERFSAGIDGGTADSATARPYEDVRDYFYDRRNHIAELDTAAEELFARNGLTVGGLDLQLTRVLREQHDIAVVIRNDDPDAPGPKRLYDPQARVLTIARRLSAGQRAFQLATQLAFLTQGARLARLIEAAESVPDRSRGVLRIGLANYFAGALILPYRQFRDAAETLRYDIELLAAKFEVGFETVCHRLSTLQRPGERGIPFFLVRTDRAGNISKRQSATAFHFSRVGGSCPLWVVHEAFSTPGRIRTQIAQMPDGRNYLWLARTTDEATPGYLSPTRDFAIGLGCDLAYAGKLVYSHGLPIDDPRTAVPIGAGCKVCERADCAQRAFPLLGRPIEVDDNRALTVPYAPAARA
ncbi:short-chain fatty acyl-CoA regulator family protein [Nocardia sp. NBC_01503]|uniref:short-chain fatty acyl-CoA regulator family protein n=1 Tax=Nocardia sp. NBC_01503 TaxID=2975997 RepID=UPI002E7BE30E|nr:short-chain fatty acyl-CoA regulator family protein [Nocardia sp. NBC_01503]WTL30872.1 short-chain fatty acyl-CoA regulator family protein [Nocardia sp. NBC_01503]